MADLLGVSQVALVHWRKDGCPCTRSGNTWLYNTVQTVDWLRARDRKSAEAPEAAEERARLLRAQAEHKELEVARLRGELVEVAEVESAWAEETARFRARVLQLVAHAAELCGMRPAEATAKAKRIVYQALEELSNGKRAQAKPAKKPRPAKATA